MTDISIIIPIYNGEKWINNCMNSIAGQTILEHQIKIEIVVYNDGSNDGTEKLLSKWAEYFSERGVSFIITGNTTCKGVGAAKNGAVKRSSGNFLCFQDIDDTMRCDRIYLQYNTAQNNHKALIGSKILRHPAESTPRLVRWANNLSTEQLTLQIYTSNGPTILMPTWFCHRSVYDRVGGFVETGCGTPEDLIFFYAHLDAGGDVFRVNEELVIYTYHEGAATFSVSRDSIWNIQLNKLEQCVFPNWEYFTVWNAGKAGRKLVRSLNKETLKKVKSFCDVDIKKVGRTIELYCPVKRTVDIKLPVIHFTQAKPPLLICVKLDLTDGQFENNLKSLNLVEGKDYILFS
ncbi:UDP-GlcNAc:betaGal beta-1,3-N-acetylglucosaminyltransferase-like protein 1 [Pectinophora gossypiella]|uniref:UDP-GlcNAc:betaGal beta-1,3-N-acetylglucosaminyltransferase-like protein 1 n=1 Tax=Pectinophora gossypiella TaxID=13191 RepID=UPI00214E2A97|nr:UDP-GlcNAc:betaGal beta-1,3-N-acetylglucosaminyltransferase-like protein 1 [Pectinophora gossypiella]